MVKLPHLITEFCPKPSASPHNITDMTMSQCHFWSSFGARIFTCQPVGQHQEGAQKIKIPCLQLETGIPSGQLLWHSFHSMSQRLTSPISRSFFPLFAVCQAADYLPFPWFLSPIFLYLRLTPWLSSLLWVLTWPTVTVPLMGLHALPVILGHLPSPHAPSDQDLTWPTP